MADTLGKAPLLSQCPAGGRPQPDPRNTHVGTGFLTMAGRDADLAEIRSAYACEMAAASGSGDPRIENAFATVPREDFVGPGPWMIMGLTAALAGERYARTLDANPAHLYRNALVALDAEKGINNGEPSLHAAWIGAVAPRPGEVVSHVG